MVTTATRLRFDSPEISRDRASKGTHTEVALRSSQSRTASLNVAEVTYRHVIVITSSNEVKFFFSVVLLSATRITQKVVDEFLMKFFRRGVRMTWIQEF